MVGYVVIISLFNSAQVHAELGFIQIELTDKALRLEHVEAHEGQRVAGSGLRKAQDVKLPLLCRILRTPTHPVSAHCCQDGAEGTAITLWVSSQNSSESGQHSTDRLHSSGVHPRLERSLSIKAQV